LNHPASPRSGVPLRVGTRGSALALAQTTTVIRLLERAHPDRAFVQHIIKSEGDTDKTSPLTQIGGRGVFTSALQERLLRGEIDLAVHSAKDVPSLSASGLQLAAYPEREDPRDALISRHGVPLAELPPNPVVGTSSRRRAVQVLALRPDATIRDLRGNIDTRLKKSRTGEYDAIVLAVAGITRMGWADAITEPLTFDRFTPAPAQGAIAVETRNDEIADLVRAIDDPAVSLAARIERAFLRGVGGGCTTPIGAYAEVTGQSVQFYAMLADDDGSHLVRKQARFEAQSAEAQAFDLAQHMLRAARPSWSLGQFPQALQGKTIVVTGSESQATPLRTELESRGANVQHLETLHILPPEQLIAIPDGASIDWVVITSPNAFRFATGALRDVVVAGAKLAAVGHRSAAAAQAHGLMPSITGDKDGQSLVGDMVKQGVAGKRIVCFLSNLASPVVPEGLRQAGADVTVVTAYRNEQVSSIDAAILATIDSGSVSAITFASPSAVNAFLKLAGEHLPAMSGAGFVAIGDTTAESMRTNGLPVHAIAKHPDPVNLAEAIYRALGTGETERQQKEES
jgi:hydroxymethylbilane synthase